ncbi:hypothetical protein [Schaalia hyovaginalis]|uniref:hypothetical protein n=1 Tax=Schaalia hyovaginalis TaxID=29316 RepID=UPI002A82B7A6|nr:hypothetical protein [Schaalia hyovaginalis]MDY4492049.1 hypothetical protein [Schaalia hyovaginalis]
MALFEFEDGRLVPAQFGRPVPSGITAEIIDAICSQVLEIVSRPLFPITWNDIVRTQDAGEAPRLTALDATGQVVSVEVVPRLDSDTLITSLSRLADAAALSWSDLAREYEGGVDAFKAGWLLFRDSMPPSPGAGPRLVMVVGAIDPQVRPALDVLSTSGVEVHEVNLRRMSNGRTFLEVAPVGPRLYGHAPQVLIGQAAAVQEIEARQKRKEVGAFAAESAPAAAPAPSDPIPSRPGPGPGAGSGPEPEPQPEPQPRLEPAEPEVPSDILRAREQGIPLLANDAEGLKVLAQIIGEEVPLVAHPDCHAPEGLILGRDGLVRSTGWVWASLHDLEQAAPALVPAWEHLRINDLRGPSLAESVAEINGEIAREYAHAPAGASGRRHVRD